MLNLGSFRPDFLSVCYDGHRECVTLSRRDTEGGRTSFADEFWLADGEHRNEMRIRGPVVQIPGFMRLCGASWRKKC